MKYCTYKLNLGIFAEAKILCREIVLNFRSNKNVIASAIVISDVLPNVVVGGITARIIK